MLVLRQFALLLSVSAAFAAAQEPSRLHRDHVLGTSLDLSVAAPAARAQAFLAAALAEVARLEAVLSTWKSDTPAAALNRGETVTNAPAELLDLLDLAETWRSRTHGAFDVRAGALVALWAAAKQQQKLPTEAAIEAAQSAMRAATVQIDRAQRSVTPAGGLALALDGIAKGYILDHALAAARAQCPDVTGALLDIGGDEVSFGKTADGKPWRIGIADPKRPQDNAPLLMEIAGSDRGVATSAGYARGFDIAGTHYSHILDPGTGRPVTGVLQATVVAADAATADALATTLCVLDPADGLELVQGLRNVECLILDAAGKRHTSRGFAKLVLSETTATSLPGGFPNGNLLQVALTLPRPEGRAKRSYTAVWIEDSKGKLVATLALWGRNRRWVSELTGWWKAIDGDADQVDAVGRASRGPGEYSLVWGGCDDGGKPLGKGDYTLVIEVSREHGGHTTSRQKVHCGEQAADWTIAATKELDGAKVHYGPGGTAK